MTPFNNISIRYKQTAIIMLTSAAALLLACAAFIAYDTITFRKALTDHVGVLAEIVGKNSAAAIDFNDSRAATETLSALEANRHIVSAAVYGDDGRLVAEYRRDDAAPSPPVSIGEDSPAGAGRSLDLFRSIEKQGTSVGTVFIRSDLSLLYARLFRFVGIVGAVLVVALLFSLVLSMYLQRRISEPILHLARLTRQVAQKEDYSVRSPLRRGDELGQLVQGFNSMLDQIQNRERALRQSREELEGRVEKRTAQLKAAQDALEKEHTRFKFIFDEVPVGIAWSDRETGTVLVNSAHERLSGVSADELDQPGVFIRATHPEDHLRQKELAKRFRTDEIDHYSLEKRYIHRDGRVIWVEFTARRYRDPVSGELQRVSTLVDITERKLIDEKLRRTEELYRRAIAGAGAVPYQLDYRSKAYVFLGEGIRELIGYPPEEIDGQLWRSIIQDTEMQGEVAGMDKDEASRRIAEGEFRTWRCDMRVITREGKSRWLADVSVQNTDEAGNVIGSMGILQDITERKQAEISASFYSEVGQDLASSTSAKEAARIIGEATDKLLGWDAYGVSLYSDSEDLVYGVLQIDEENGQRVEFEPLPAQSPSIMARRIFDSGGELILRETPQAPPAEMSPFGDATRGSASLMYVPMHYGSRMLGYLTIQSYTPNAYTEADLKTLQELADRCAGAMKRIWAEEARRQSESQFRLVWESSTEGMRLADAEGVIHAVNEAYCQMVGRSRTELEGQPISVVEPAEKADSLLRNYRERFASKRVRSYKESRAVLWNGREAWFEVSDSRLELPEQPPILLSIFRDITLRKEAEGKLAEMNRQLLDASRQAGMAEIATNVLHNVGNVLNSVNVSTTLLADNVRQSRVSRVAQVAALLKEHEEDLGSFMLSDRGRQVPVYLAQLAEHLEKERTGLDTEVESVRGNIEHIKDIVAMQQNYARVSGLRELTDMTGLVEDSLRLNADTLLRHNVEVVREFEAVPEANIEKHKVIQILVNLVRNAKHACDDSGRFDKRITVKLEKNDENIRITVADNGVGIPAENMTRIFNHGFTTRKKGHGFGLHSAALAAREIGGALTAHSDGAGEGAAFTLEIPIQPRSDELDADVPSITPAEASRNESTQPANSSDV